jgi:magnesium transporter
MIYVIDDKKRLLDEIRLRKILLAESSQKISELMDNEYVCLRADQHEKEAVDYFRKNDLYALPVVDSHNVLVGMVTVDDVLDVAEAEAAEEIQKSAAIVPLYGNYRDAHPAKLFARRVVWLLALILVTSYLPR